MSINHGVPHSFSHASLFLSVLSEREEKIAVVVLEANYDICRKTPSEVKERNECLAGSSIESLVRVSLHRIIEFVHADVSDLLCLLLDDHSVLVTASQADSSPVFPDTSLLQLIPMELLM